MAPPKKPAETPQTPTQGAQPYSPLPAAHTKGQQPGQMPTPPPAPRLPQFPSLGRGTTPQGNPSFQTPPPSPVTPQPDAPAPAASSGLDPELDNLYKDIFNEHQNSWAGTESQINAQTAMNQRRAAEINASMGRSIGGGFAGLYSQALLNGQQQMMGARQTWADRGRQLQLGYLDRQLTEKHRTEDLEHEAAINGANVPGGGPASNQSKKYPDLFEVDSQGRSGEGMLASFKQSYPDMSEQALDAAAMYASNFHKDPGNKGGWPSGTEVLQYLKQQGLL